MTTSLSPAAESLLRRVARHLDGALVVCGFPASGKSTAARFVAGLSDAVVLDKDTHAPELEVSVMSRLTEPHDRDSDTYKTLVAPHLYLSLIRTGLTVAAKHPVVLDGPFLGAIQDAADAEKRLSEHLYDIAGVDEVVPVTTVWLDSDASEIRTRMRERGAERDTPKLRDWDTYQTTVLDSGIRTLAHKLVDFVIPN
ncbi:AAA family ATPase [Nocardia nova]|uniref:AAA family ATPase n=1 Tax=Nocardia nova TaxID=37330 RepID=UPI0015E2B2D8|nr:AAA family ATPase [Nocardia nova]